MKASEYRQLKRTRNFNLYLFLVMNFVLVSILSTLRLDPDRDSLLDINLDFSFSRTLLILFIVGLLQVLLLYMVSYQMFQNPEIIKIYSDGKLIENFKLEQRNEISQNYDIEQINSMVLDLADKMDVEVNTIYLTSTPIPNAFTFSLPGRGSIVNINTNILDFLSKPEIEAVILHELGHIRENDSFQKLLANTPTMFIQIALSYFYAIFILSILNSLLIDFNLSLTLLRSVILFLFLMLSRFIVYLTRILIARSEKASEMICDLHAADLSSPVTTINMLVHLGQRVETVNTLMSEYARMEKMQRKILTAEDQRKLIHLVGQFPLYEIDESQAKMYAPFLYILNQLEVLREVYGVPLSSEEIYDLASKSAEQHILTDTKESKMIEKMTTNWREFDINKDQLLSEEELKDFVKTLYQEKKKFLFSNEIYVDHLVQEHPDFRKRILSVYQSYFGEFGS